MARLILSKTAEKNFSKLSVKDRKKVTKKLRFLESDPMSGKKLLGELKGFFSLRAWPYRIIYELKGPKKIIVHHISHRQQAYK
ncbi:type II toxin-antitoxin system RelE/ParE family toxin [Patescibacteria group bacterium]